MANYMNAHDQVWDDSALLNTWDEAVAEYKKYHSLAAKGETIPIEPQIEEVKPAHSTNPKQPKKQPQATPTVNASQSNTGAQQSLPSDPEFQTRSAQEAMPGAAAVPQTLMGNVQDEGMKNLMMSWYYAGYYTGLYEGKQTAYASMAGSGPG